MQMQTSGTMRALIEGFEGLRLTAYQDSVGVWTIGYGHTGPDVHNGLSITKVEADYMMEADLRKFETAVNTMAMLATTQQQFDALVSFAYNLGAAALKSSTLLRQHNAQQYTAAAAEFAQWDHAGGQVLAGLARRRAVEAAVYAKGDYGSGTAIA